MSVNAYIFTDTDSRDSKVLASTMEAALNYWNNNNAAEPASIEISEHNVTVAGDVQDPAVTISNPDTAKGTLYPTAGFTVAEGSEVIFTAVPATGFVFTKWTKTSGGVSSDVTDNPAKIRITADTTIAVTWSAS